MTEERPCKRVRQEAARLMRLRMRTLFAKETPLAEEQERLQRARDELKNKKEARRLLALRHQKAVKAGTLSTLDIWFARYGWD